jgi:hypothetical protein
MPGIFPDTLESLTIHYRDDDDSMREALQPNILPSSLKHLTTNYLFENHPIGENVLPSSLETLTLYYMIIYEEGGEKSLCSTFNFPLLPNTLPLSLKELRFGGAFNQLIDKDVLLSSLKELHFGYHFNQPIDKHVLPQSLIKLEFGQKFNQPIAKDVLPSSLERLTFQWGSVFDRRIAKDVLPQSLKELRFGNNYDRRITKEVLPQSLTELKIGDRPIDLETTNTTSTADDTDSPPQTRARTIESPSSARTVATRAAAASTLLSVDPDVFRHHLLHYLNDCDAIRCLSACKTMHSRYLHHYVVKKLVEVSKLSDHFYGDSDRSVPILVNIGIQFDDDDAYDVDECREIYQQ